MTLRIHVASDDHDDISKNKIRCDEVFTGEADLIVHAGDLQALGAFDPAMLVPEDATCSLMRLRELYPDRSIPLVYVAGNHDFYSDGNVKTPWLKTTLERQLRDMPELADKLGIILLQDSTVELNVAGVDVRLTGGTAWTGMEARPPYLSINDAMRDAAKAMNDYRFTKIEPGRSKDTMRPTDTIAMHRATVRHIEETLETPFNGETIVVTHHAPSYRSLRDWDPEYPQRFRHMDHCYASDLEYLMHGDNAPALWIHGHVHANQDYVVGNTRVLANPRGYPLYALGMVGRENPDYDPQLVVELEPRYTPRFGM
jgi:predicted phosphodiesterase